MDDPEAEASEAFLEYVAALISDQWWFALIAGVSFANDDGTSRQAILSACKGRDPLYLKADPTNAFDPNAVKVMTTNGGQLGWLHKPDAARVMRGAKKGHRFTAFICSIARPKGVRSYGAKIALMRLNPEYRAKFLELEAAAKLAGLPTPPITISPTREKAGTAAPKEIPHAPTSAQTTPLTDSQPKWPPSAKIAVILLSLALFFMLSYLEFQHR